MTDATKPVSVMIADDDPVFANMLKLTLEQKGIREIALAENGKAVARQMAQGNSPDIITLDLNMPDCDGVEVIRMLAGAGFGGLVILISGADQAVVQAASVYAEATLQTKPEVFYKPVNWEEIAGIIQGFAVSAR